MYLFKLILSYTFYQKMEQIDETKLYQILHKILFCMPAYNRTGIVTETNKQKSKQTKNQTCAKK